MVKVIAQSRLVRCRMLQFVLEEAGYERKMRDA